MRVARRMGLDPILSLLSSLLPPVEAWSELSNTGSFHTPPFSSSHRRLCELHLYVRRFFHFIFNVQGTRALRLRAFPA
jgi:hypothetical protein